MMTVVTYTKRVFIALITLSVQNTHTSYALEHRCMGTYAIDTQQEDLRTRVAALVCVKQGCSCESYTPLATEICRLLSLNKRLGQEDISSLASIIAQDTGALIKKAPACGSTPFHLPLSCREIFGCSHKDGNYLSNNLAAVLSALMKATFNGITRPYSRQYLLHKLTNGEFRTALEVANKIEELDHIKKIMVQEVEAAVLNAYWQKAGEEKLERDKKRKHIIRTADV